MWHSNPKSRLYPTKQVKAKKALVSLIQHNLFNLNPAESVIQLFSRRFGSLAKPRAHRTRMKMKSPTLRSTRLQCGRPEGVRHLFWAISAVGKETCISGACSVAFVPTVSSSLHVCIELSILYWGSAKLHSPVAAYLQADGFGPLVLCIFCFVRSLLNYLTPRWHFDMFVGRVPVVGDTDKYWCTVTLRRSALFRVSYRCSWWWKERRPAKGWERKGFRQWRYPPTKIRLKCTNHKPMKSFLQMCFKVLWIYHCARVSRVWNIEFERLSQMSFYKLQIVAMQTDLEWFI